MTKVRGGTPRSRGWSVESLVSWRSGRKSRRLRNSEEDDMYYSEPEIFERTRMNVRSQARASSSDSFKPPTSEISFIRKASSGVYFVARRSNSSSNEPTPGLSTSERPSAEASVGQSEDEDGTLFKTLTKEGAKEVREANSLRVTSPAPTSPGGAIKQPPPISWAQQVEAELGGVVEGNYMRFPASLLKEYAKLPMIIEYVINHGILVCLSGLLYELTLMPLSATRGVIKILLRDSESVSNIEKSDLIRVSVLVVAVWVFNASIDFSAVYHYVRAQSLLKLYFIFNMLEILERLVRSWGNDLVDGMVWSVVSPSSSWASVGIHWSVVLVYSLLHAYMHFWRVMIISVAILTNDIMIVLVTNNFNELKGSVFKKAEPRSVYPIVSSDIVERLYLFLDIGLVLFRMATSPQRSKMPFSEVFIWAGVMVGLEVVTDWLKFLCISKFNQVDNSTFLHYSRIHKDDVLNCRNSECNPIPPLVQKGFVAASHQPVRRMNFMPTPLAVLILCNLMLPNLVGADLLPLWTYRGLVIAFFFTLKFTIDWMLIGESVSTDRSCPLPEKLQNIRSL